MLTFEENNINYPNSRVPKQSRILSLVQKAGIKDTRALSIILTGAIALCILLSFLVYTDSFKEKVPPPTIYIEDVTPELRHLFTDEQLLEMPSKRAQQNQ